MEGMIELWQRAIIDESKMDKVYRTEDLVPMIMHLQRKQQKLVRFKTLSVIIIMLSLLILFLNRTSISLYSGLGMAIFFSSVLLIVLIINRLRFRIKDEERSLSMLQLAEIADQKINSERKLFTFYLPLFMVVALVGFNLMYVDFFKEEETGTRILYHLTISGSVLLGFILGMTVRIKRFRREFLPVKERINKFRNEAEAV